MIARALALALLCVGCQSPRAATAPSPRAPRPALPTALPEATLPAREATLPNGLRVVVGEGPELGNVSVALVHGAGNSARWRRSLAGVQARACILRRLTALAAPPSGPGVLAPGQLWERDASEAYVYQAHPTSLGYAMLGLARALRGATADPPSAVGPSVAPGAGGASAAEVCRYIRTQFRPDNTAIVVVGPITFGAVMAYAERLLGPWGSSAPEATRAGFAVPPAPVAAEDARFRLASMPWRVESDIRVEIRARVATGRERAAAEVAFERLFPTLGSPLMRALRGEQGDVYQAESGFPHEADGVVDAWYAFVVERPRVGPSLRAIRRALDRFATGGVDARALDSARRGVFARWRRRSLRQPEYTWALVDASLAGRPAGTPPAWFDDVRTITPAEVSA